MKTLMMLVCAMSLVGCAMYGGPGVSGAYPGSIITNATYPGAAAWSDVNYDMRDYEIVGEVNADAESTSILGILASGDSGYIKLFQAAKAQGAHDVIGVKIDVHYYNILNLYSKVTNKLHGWAIKWKK